MTRPRIAGTALQARTARNSSVEDPTADQAPYPAQDKRIQIKKENANHGAACEQSESQTRQPATPSRKSEAECLGTDTGDCTENREQPDETPRGPLPEHDQ